MTLSRAKAKLLARLGQRKGREREGLFLAEGIRLAREALAAGAEVSFALLSPRALQLAGGSAVKDALEAANVETHLVEDAELASYAGTEKPQGVLLVCREPPVGLDALVGEGGAPRLLVLDGLQDPGNAGTLLRAAFAFALTGVVFLDRTVDPFNAKVVRASAGAVFRLPIVREPWERFGPWLGVRGFRCLVSDGTGQDVAELDTAPPWALVIGSEASGARPEVAGAAHAVVSVPMPGGSESLNAAMAGSILLYMMTREDERG